MCKSDEAQIARQILAYLLTHTEAQDTVEGIVEWWILEQTINQYVGQVRKAVDGLAAKKLLLTYQTGDSTIYYKLNRRRMKAIHTLLENLDESKK